MIPPLSHLGSPETTTTRTLSSPNKVATYLDGCILQTYGCIGSRANHTTVLIFLLYSARLASSLLEAAGGNAIALKSALPLKRGSYGSLSQAADRLGFFTISLAKCSKQALGTISQALAFGRLWGLLGVYFSLKRLIKAQTSSTSNADQTRVSGSGTAIASIQLLLLSSYFAADNVNFLSGRKILAVSSSTRASLARWSMRSYMLYIAVDVGRLIAQRLGLGDEVMSETWRKQLLRGLAMFSIALNNSIDHFPLNDFMISLLGFYQSGSRMRDLWQDNAVQVNEQDGRGQENLVVDKSMQPSKSMK